MNWQHRRSSVPLDNTIQVIHNSCKASDKAECIMRRFAQCCRAGRSTSYLFTFLLFYLFTFNQLFYLFTFNQLFYLFTFLLFYF